MTTELWAKVELLGHLSLAGRITEVEMFGGKLGRVDVPRPDGSFETHYFGAGSVYQISVVSEAVARQLATHVAPPVSPWDWPKALPAPDCTTVVPQQEGFDAEDVLDTEPPF